jgi:hypothetical protein
MARGGHQRPQNRLPGVLQHDIPLQPAECGGLLISVKGEVVGWNVARRAQSLPLLSRCGCSGITRTKLRKLPKIKTGCLGEVGAFCGVVRHGSAGNRRVVLKTMEGGKSSRRWARAARGTSVFTAACCAAPWKVPIRETAGSSVGQMMIGLHLTASRGRRHLVMALMALLITTGSAGAVATRHIK